MSGFKGGTSTRPIFLDLPSSQSIPGSSTWNRHWCGNPSSNPDTVRVLQVFERSSYVWKVGLSREELESVTDDGFG